MMYTYDQICMINLSDCYTMLYGYLVDSMLQTFGETGERAAREGTRRFGRDRAMTSRNKHLGWGVKINMKSLFTMSHDLPSDPRFRRELQELNEQERVSHTLVCPMADIWKACGHMHIGRMYCEEFHFACYNTYAYGHTQVNLAKTLTQEGDEYCSFNVVLRPENLPEELKPVCFAEYDPGYVAPSVPGPNVTGKGGFNTLSIKLYYYLLEAAEEQLGEAGVKAICAGLARLAEVSAQRMRQSAAEAGLPLDEKYVEDNFPLIQHPEDEPMWATYGKHNAKQLLQQHFYPAFQKLVGLNV